MGLSDTGMQVTLTLIYLNIIPGTQCDYKLSEQAEDTKHMSEAFGALYTWGFHALLNLI